MDVRMFEKDIQRILYDSSVGFTWTGKKYILKKEALEELMLYVATHTSR